MILGITRQTVASEPKVIGAKGAINLRYGRVEIQSKEMILVLLRRMKCTDASVDPGDQSMMLVIHLLYG